VGDEADRHTAEASASPGQGRGAGQGRTSPPRRPILDLLPTAKVDEECRRLLDEVRKRCPDAFPAPPLEPSERGPDLPLRTKELGVLVRVAAAEGGTDVQLWQRDGDELAVTVGALDVHTGEGTVIVTIPVDCDQTGPAKAQVAFAVGSKGRPAGMLATASRRPRGPAVVVDAWADELTALAWGALSRGVTSLAREAGRDTDGAGLVPFGIEAGADGLLVRTIARHAFDRKRP
jgi:hypothetical protein